MTVSINGTSGLVFNDASTQNTSAFTGGFAFRNRIINGAMVIDQRNAGASVTPTTGAYTVDRFAAYLTQASKFTVQQNAGSVTPPSGFKNYLGATSSSAYSVSSSDYFLLAQSIEGLNVSDLGWGAVGAATITLSFWVRSSLTGTFGASITNSGSSRSYPFSYVINSANTWEQKSVTISGDTTGTWLTTNGIGMTVWFSLGAGSTVSGTAGSWSGSTLLSATGATSVVGTSGATFYITGVQLEKGSTATSFDYRPYGTELQLCQRYYQVLDGSLATYSIGGAAMANYYRNLATMRSSPTVTVTTAPTYVNASGITSDENTTTGVRFYVSVTTTGRAFATAFVYTCASEL
jgi:hypothetical protein